MRPGLVRAIGFELLKLRATRSTVWTLVAVGVTLPALAVFVGATESLQPDDTIVGGSLTGAILAQMLAAAFGALVMTTEYTSGAITTTFSAVPHRLTVLAAKAVVVATATFVVALGATTTALIIGRSMLDGDRYPAGDPGPALVGVALALTVSGLLGLGLGTAVRRSAGAVAAALGVQLLPTFIGPLLGDLERWVGGGSPSGALIKLTQTSDATAEAVGTLGAWPSLAIVAGYVALILGGSAALLRSRDV